MADTTTTYLGLTKPEIGTTGYAPKINTDLDLIDTAFGAKTPRVIANGTVTGGTLSLAMPAPLNGRYMLVIDGIRMPTSDDAALFARLSVDGGSTYLTGASDYEYARRDLTNQSSGTQALAASAGADAIILTPTLDGSATTALPRHSVVIDIVSSVYNAGASFSISLTSRSVHRTASGYRGGSEVYGGLVSGQTASVGGIRIGGVAGSDYTKQVDLVYTLYYVPSASI